MDKRMLDIKEWQLRSLKGKTKNEKLKEINNRLFTIDMMDYQDEEDKKMVMILNEIKREVEQENEKVKW